MTAYRTGQDWVLVTGAAGFIGSNIVNHLAAAGRTVVACDWLGKDDRWRHCASAYLHDWIHPDDLLPWLDIHAASISTIIHLGAISDTTERRMDALVSQNIRCTLDLWELAVTHGWQFLYASSAATYGDGSAGFLDDDQPEYLARLHPLNAYGWSKHLVDRRIVQDWRSGRPVPPNWAGMKFFNVYGPNEDHKGHMRSVIRKIMPVIASGAPVELFQSHHPDYADGGQMRDFVYVADVCAWIDQALMLPGLAGLYNIGSGRARSFKDLAEATYRAMGMEPNIRYIPMPDTIRAQYQYFTEAEMAKSVALGISPPRFSLEDGVADYVRQIGVTVEGGQA